MSRYEDHNPSYRASLIDAGRGHLLGDPHSGGPSYRDPHPGRAFCNPCRVAADLPALERMHTLCLDHRLEPEELCLGCHTERRTKDRDLCPSCTQDMADDLAERDRCEEHPGTRCTNACGHCGRCG
jgi:hypothetical protein